MSEMLRVTMGAGSCGRCGRALRASQHEEQASGLCLLCLNGAPELSPAEQALWNRPAAEESLTAQLAKVLRLADLNGAAPIGFDTDEMDAAYLRMAEAAVEHLTGRTA